MAVTLHKPGYDYAVAIIKKGLEIEHDSNNWEAVKPTQDEIVRYLNTHTLDEYGLWFLGIDSSRDPKDKSKFMYPYGDFKVLHKSALIAALKEAAKNNHEEIKTAAQKLVAMVGTKK